MRTIYVTVGLPASGKTSYYDNLVHYGEQVTLIEMDKFRGQSLRSTLETIQFPKGNIYLDGLFITKTSQDIIVEFFNTFKDTKIEFLYFNTSKQRCLLRDKSRVVMEERNKSCTNIIRNAKINIPRKVTVIEE